MNAPPSLRHNENAPLSSPTQNQPPRLRGPFWVSVLLTSALALLLSLPSACSAATIMSKPGNALGLVGWWTMDGNDINWSTGAITDRSGTGNTGYVVNMSTSTSPAAGRFGQGMRFDGSDQYINLGQPAITANLGSSTISAWIYLTHETGLYKYIWDRGGRIGLRLDQNRLPIFHVEYSASSQQYRMAAWGYEVPLGTWTHLAVTRGSSTLGTDVHIYENGSEIG